jgi:hypothetical protein
MGFFDSITSGLTSAFSGGGGSGGSGILSSALGLASAERTNQQQVGLSREQMDFQRNMSNTAYQRAMADMKAAGLNPMLAYQQGGASVPGGAMAKLIDPWSSAVSAGTATAQTASNVSKQSAEVGRITQEIRNLKAGEKLTAEQTKQVATVISHIKEQIQKTIAEKGLTKSKDYSQQLENVKNAIVTKFFQGNQGQLIAKEIGVGDGVFRTIVKSVIGVGEAVKDSADEGFSKIISKKDGKYYWGNPN